MKTNDQIMEARCRFCGGENPDEQGLCPRCAAINAVLGGETEMINLFLPVFWDHCFQCGAEVLSITGTSLTPDTLVFQCDGCGEVHEIPFALEDIQWYIRSGIVRELSND